METLAQVTAGKFYVDYTKGMVYYHVDPAETETDAIINYRAEFFGTPSGWDFKGSVGVLRILLKF